MSYALTRLTGDGSTQTFTIGFAYRDKADIVVKVDGILKYLTSDYTFVTDSQIRFNTAPATDAAIVIRRATSQHNRLVDYVSGAVFRESDLDTDSTQGFFMAQESIDIANDSMAKNDSNLFDAENIRVINVADPVGDKDAANKEYVQSALADQNQRYYGSLATAPSSPDVEEGDLYWDTTSKGMKVHNGTGWQDATAALSTASARTVYVVGTTSGAYGGSTHIFPTAYDAGFVDVFLNGAKLQEGTDFIATNGYNIELTSVATNGDIIDIISYGTQTLTNVEAIIDNVSDINTVAPHVASIGTVAADLSGSNTIGSSLTNATNAASSASAAATSESNAATSATNAATSESNAATSETNAAASAASIIGLTTATGAEGTSVSYDSTTGVLTVPKGDTGDGFTGGSYDSTTGQITFSSNDGLGFTTTDLRPNEVERIVQPNGTVTAQSDTYGLDITGVTHIGGYGTNMGTLGINTHRVALHPLDVENTSLSTVGRFQCSAANTAALIQIENASTTNVMQGLGAIGDDVLIYTDSSESLRVKKNGNVGIGYGKSNPAYTLDVGGGTDEIVASFDSTDEGAYIRIVDHSGSTGALVGAKGDELSIVTGTSEKVRLKANGNFGINELNPTEALDVGGNINASGTITASGYNSSNWDTAYSNHITGVSYSGSTLTLTQQDGGTITTTINASGGGGSSLWTASSSDIYYNSGNVGIGTSSPTVKLDVETQATGNVASFTGAHPSRNLLITNYTSGGDGSSYAINANSGYGQIKLQTVSNDRIKIDNNGDISFYEDTGTTPKFFWDASAESLGIGTTSPSRKLDVAGQIKADDAIEIQGNGYARLEVGGGTGAYIDLKTPDSDDYDVRLITDGSGGILNVASGEFVIQRGGSQKLATTSTGINVTGSMTTTGNVGIGTGSPATTLTVTGSYANGIELDRNGADATASARLFFDSSSGGTAIYNHQGNTLFSTGATAGSASGTERMRITSSGNVGIGTSSPATELDVSGDITLSGSINGNTIFKSPTGATEYARFTTAGLGIGKSSPFVKLHVQGTSQGSGCSVTQNTSAFFDAQTNNYIGIGGGSTSTLGINFGDSTDADSGRILYRNSVDTMAFYTLANERMTIDQSGNVGVGTTTPLSRMHLKKYSTASGVAPNTGAALFLDDASSAVLQMGAAYYGTSSILFGKGASGSTSADNDIGSISYSNYYNYLAFRVNAGERMRIDSSGSLLVGQTSAGSYGAKVRVGGVTESTYYVATGSGTRFLNSGYYGSAGINVEAYTDSSTTTVNLVSFKSLSGVQKGSISLVANTVSYNTTSDERLKENIKDAEDAGDKIDAIQVRQFDWKDGGQHQDYGVIAQELDKVAPEAVTKGETEDDMMSVDYSKLVPTLIKEIQTLRNRVAELEKN